ncbi:hypothetical protein PsYK624_097530 [Phanerochaete sordida]|uniref:Uncharacterized protein n=1 Tax=Phanerochaete sordida TaxID=48140 RepID=A0A9P3GEV0_9APHY|nr:hypothetical protein PsYK624_097530 [Phanerochaete sordida]
MKGRTYRFRRHRCQHRPPSTLQAVVALHTVLAATGTESQTDTREDFAERRGKAGPPSRETVGYSGVVAHLSVLLAPRRQRRARQGAQPRLPLGRSKDLRCMRTCGLYGCLLSIHLKNITPPSRPSASYCRLSSERNRSTPRRPLGEMPVKLSRVLLHATPGAKQTETVLASSSSCECVGARGGPRKPAVVPHRACCAAPRGRAHAEAAGPPRRRRRCPARTVIGTAPGTAVRARSCSPVGRRKLRSEMARRSVPGLACLCVTSSESELATKRSARRKNSAPVPRSLRRCDRNTIRAYWRVKRRSQWSRRPMELFPPCAIANGLAGQPSPPPNFRGANGSIYPSTHNTSPHPPCLPTPPILTPHTHPATAPRRPPTPQPQRSRPERTTPASGSATRATPSWRAQGPPRCPDLGPDVPAPEQRAARLGVSAGGTGLVWRRRWARARARAAVRG